MRARIIARTTVANIRSLPAGWLDDPRYVYIGRRNPRAKLLGSPYANPFRIGKDGNRAEVIERYRTWIRSRPELMQRAATELRGKTLVCWCAPEECHGDVLAELANGPLATEGNKP